jgi:hypothetical protein
MLPRLRRQAMPAQPGRAAHCFQKDNQEDEDVSVVRNKRQKVTHMLKR